MLAVQWTSGKVTLGANGGVLLRKPRTVFENEVGQQFTYGAAGAAHLNRRVTLIAEAFGRGSITGSNGISSPVEVNGGLRFSATSALSILAGGGAGLSQTIGSPGLRLFLSVGWSPDLRDDDGDRVANHQDKCPLEQEDRDGWQDNDGCPDPDNDGDKRPDTEDKCPNKKEDLDGHQDDDGCRSPTTTVTTFPISTIGVQTT